MGSAEDTVAFAVEPERYDEFLAEKVERVRSSLTPFLDGLDVRVYASEPNGYRLRCRCDIATGGDGRTTYCMWNWSPGPKVYFRQLPAVTPRINTVMAQLLDCLDTSAVLRRKLVMANFLGTLNTPDVVVTLVYDADSLADEWDAESRELQSSLGAVGIVARCRGDTIPQHPRFWPRHRVVGQDYVTEQLHVGGRTLTYRQPEGSFSNPNGGVNTKCLEWLSGIAEGVAASQDKKTDLLEMYCGNGNHTVCLAGHFAKLLAVEINGDLVRTARGNLAENGCGDDAIVLEVPSDRFSRDILRTRRYTDAESNSSVDVSEYDFRTVLVDPPRGGLDKATLRMLRNFDDILYISCNPQSLQANLAQLCKTHDVAAVAFFDHFPFTPFLETGLHLKWRGSHRRQAGGS